MEIIRCVLSSRQTDMVCIALLLFGALWFSLRPGVIYVAAPMAFDVTSGYAPSDGFTVVSSR